ncbi:hypothetical protein [Amycolatopsis sp. DG1A-15b]|nr:hypothetical protein [Amycolatopsis sp. DG1A-15b]WIX85682.1 hypothetical protein QRY02_31260 [Amycolatopsis sp. DG1A-15b]
MGFDRDQQDDAQKNRITVTISGTMTVTATRLVTLLVLVLTGLSNLYPH